MKTFFLSLEIDKEKTTTNEKQPSVTGKGNQTSHPNATQTEELPEEKKELFKERKSSEFQLGLGLGDVRIVSFIWSGRN